ncbi:TBC1 domain protein [Wickerhamomyces ciferrii]|uniref:TBC1 domain protein n=1 Tax=Wickerhamomyces ciferrii (strain ATCC 14091 / BCRC 22168 / CBS 111 / JCM 3599 / NBRC 0793 / NRRL Y-1031 F-60-10) TaxID=1206466 RepID=K0KFG2_WICCF|nr:TBC1 domain protein [Wickerhamomyces ciferrii]CCH40967.1 TBC1 domain protein [Wickerhamomyces ciferrii]
MSVSSADWDTLSMKLDNSIVDSTLFKSNDSLKEPSLSTAIDLNDYKIVQFLAKTKGGLINSNFRKKAWPLLLGVDMEKFHGLCASRYSVDWKSKPQHKDEDQVSLDVDRSFIYYAENGSDSVKTELKSKLNDLILRILRENPQLCYYQGYHDICSVFLVIFSNEMELCFQCVQNFTLLYLRDFMMPSINESIKILKLIPPLVQKVDAQIYNELLLGDIEPFYAISPLITLFSHNITSFSSISQIFDGILANGSLGIIIYYYISLLLSQKENIFQKISLMEEEDCFTKQDVIHDVLSKFILNIEKNTIEQSLEDCTKITKRAPLEKLLPFHQIQRNSVLRTSPLINDLDIKEIKDRLAFITEAILEDQVEGSKITDPSSKATRFSIKDALAKKQNQTLFKMSLTIGIIGLLLNIILKKNEAFQLQTPITQLWNTHSEIINIGIRPIRDLLPKFF